MTDEKGAYRISGTQKPEWLVSAAKPGYFTATSYVSIPGRQDFDMENETPVPLGQTVRLTPGQSRCASWGYGGGGGAACQRVVVDVVSAGLLEVRVLAPQFEFIDIPFSTRAAASSFTSQPDRLQLVQSRCRRAATRSTSCSVRVRGQTSSYSRSCAESVSMTRG
jgi:hypothetical protein